MGDQQTSTSGKIAMNEITQRFRKKERIVRYFQLFLDDESFRLLEDSMKLGDYQSAFRAAHTLKGVCLNLGLTSLQAAASNMTEALRGGKPADDADVLMDMLRQEYDDTVKVIKDYIEENS